MIFFTYPTVLDVWFVAGSMGSLRSTGKEYLVVTDEGADDREFQLSALLKFR